MQDKDHPLIPNTHTHGQREREQEEGFRLDKFFTCTRAHMHTPSRRLGFLFKKEIET